MCIIDLSSSNPNSVHWQLSSFYINQKEKKRNFINDFQDGIERWEQTKLVELLFTVHSIYNFSFAQCPIRHQAMEIDWKFSLEQQLSGIFINSFANKQTTKCGMHFEFQYASNDDQRFVAKQQCNHYICFRSASLQCKHNEHIGYVIFDSWFFALSRNRNIGQMKHATHFSLIFRYFTIFFFSRFNVKLDALVQINFSTHGVPGIIYTDRSTNISHRNSASLRRQEKFTAKWKV